MTPIKECTECVPCLNQDVSQTIICPFLNYKILVSAVFIETIGVSIISVYKLITENTKHALVKIGKIKLTIYER